MVSKSDIEEKFYRCYYPLKEEELIGLSNLNTPGLNNVIVGLDKHCFAIILMDDTTNIVYRLLYANRFPFLQGDLIELSIDNTDRDNILFYFSQFLEHNYKDLNAIDVFNTFQKNTRTMLESFGHLSVSSTEFENIDDPNPMIIANGVKSIVTVSYINKINFYKSFFASSSNNTQFISEEYIYLMLNNRNNRFKIGRSKKPHFREKTLQSDEPEIELLVHWKAPGNIEKQLHKMCFSKNRRGEWFELPLSQLNKIKQFMEPYTAYL